MAVFGRFPGLSLVGWSSYRPCRKSVLNRKFAENNFFARKFEKQSIFFWKYKNSHYLCTRVEEITRRTRPVPRLKQQQLWQR